MKLINKKTAIKFTALVIVFMLALMYSSTLVMAATVGINETSFSTGTLFGLTGGANSLKITNPGAVFFNRSSGATLLNGSSVGANVPRFEAGKFGQALTIEEPTTNLLSANQSNLETDISGWTGGNCIAVRDTTQHWEGVASLKQTATVGGDNMVVTSLIAVSPNINYSVSADVNVPTPITEGGSAYLRIIEWNSSGGLNADTIISWGGITSTSGWQRLSGTFTTKTTTATINIRLMQTGVGTVYWDGIQLEQKGFSTSFITGGTNRTLEQLKVSAVNILSPNKGTIQFWIYRNNSNNIYQNPFSILASSGDANRFSLEGGGPLIPGSRTDDFYIALADNLGGYGSLPPKITISKTIWHNIAISWDNGTYKAYLDGNLVPGFPYIATKIPSSFAGNNLEIGYNNNWGENGRVINGYIDDFKISSRAKTDAEILADYNSGQALLVDKDTSYKLNFDNSLVSGAGGYRDSDVKNISFSAPVTPPQTYNVSWTKTLNSGAVTIQSRVSKNGGATWTAFKNLTNGGAIPDISAADNLSKARLQFRQIITSPNVGQSPILQSVVAKITTENPNFNYSVFPTALNINVNPSDLKNAKSDITISVSNNIFSSAYVVKVSVDKQPTNAKNQVFPYVNGGPGQGAGFISSSSIIKGFGYTMLKSSGSPVIPAGFVNGAKYASFNMVDEIVLTGGKTVGDVAVMRVGSWVDYTVPSGSFNDVITLTFSNTF